MDRRGFLKTLAAGAAALITWPALTKTKKKVPEIIDECRIHLIGFYQPDGPVVLTTFPPVDTTFGVLKKGDIFIDQGAHPKRNPYWIATSDSWNEYIPGGKYAGKYVATVSREEFTSFSGQTFVGKRAFMEMREEMPERGNGIYTWTNEEG